MKKLASGLGLILILMISGCQARVVSPPTTPTPSETPPAGSWEIDTGLQYGREAISGDLLVGYKFDLNGANIDEGKFPGQTLIVYNLKTKEQERTIEIPGGYMINTPSIYGNKVVFDAVDKNDYFRSGALTKDVPAPNYDIFLFDMGTNLMKQITTEEHAQMSPRIYGDTVIWLDSRNVPQDNQPRSFDIYTLDLKTNKEKRITTAPTVDDYSELAINGDRVVWTDIRHADSGISSHASNDPKYNNEIYAYDLTTDQEQRITDSSANDHYPDINGKRIIWSRQWTFKKADVFMFDLATDQNTQISHSGYAESNPAIYGDKIVWTDASSSQGNTSGDLVINAQKAGSVITLFDLNTQKETQLTQVEAGTVWLQPVVHTNHVVFYWARGIGTIAYAFNLP